MSSLTCPFQVLQVLPELQQLSKSKQINWVYITISYFHNLICDILIHFSLVHISDTMKLDKNKLIYVPKPLYIVSHVEIYAEMHIVPCFSYRQVKDKIWLKILDVISNIEPQTCKFLSLLTAPNSSRCLMAASRDCKNKKNTIRTRNMMVHAVLE